ncbi:MAG: acyltransferase [Methylophilaceae bacterium]
MALRNEHLSSIRSFIVYIMRQIYRKIYSMDIHPTVNFSLSAKFDKANPRGIHIDEYSYIAFDAAILTHDFTRGVRSHTRIGKNCFIGAKSIIMPGVKVSDNSIVGAGSIVIKDVASNVIVAGNPAKVIKENIDVGKFGRLKTADKTQTLHRKTNDLD